MAENQKDDSGLVELVVIARAAHLNKNRSMKLKAVEQLREQFGVVVSFTKPKAEAVTC